MRAVLYCLLMLVPLSAHAVFLDCVFFNGFENPGTTDTAALGALQVHNCARKTVDPPASTPIQSLVWNSTVATTAQTWANNCNYSHNGIQVGYGQNIYAASGFTPTLTDASNAWASEEPNYNYATNTCASGKVCGHYTQMVWSSTTQLGCGQALCTTTPPSPLGSPWYFIVCDYNPPGNFNNLTPY